MQNTERSNDTDGNAGLDRTRGAPGSRLPRNARLSITAAGSFLDEVAALDVDVLLYGERGVGKRQLARELHRRSPRSAAGQFLVVNCALQPIERLEAELFGTARRAGSAVERRGALDEAARGTVFLEELDAMPVPPQVRLVEALEHQEFTRLGADEPTRLDARVIAATTVDPEALVATGRLRADLYDRLRAVTIVVLPLRERRDEIPGLVTELVARYATQYGVEPLTIGPAALQSLVEHSWPGNLPELESIVERLVLDRSDAWLAAELDRSQRATGQTGAPRRRPRRRRHRSQGFHLPMLDGAAPLAVTLITLA